jgi:hypothetical protein
MHENLAYGLAVRCNLTCGSRMTAEVEELSQFLIKICEHYRYPDTITGSNPSRRV